MGLGSMPPDTGPDYDEWLFTKSWQAALASREAEMGEMRDIIEIFRMGIKEALDNLETSALALDIGDAITQYGTYEGVRVTPVEDTK